MDQKITDRKCPCCSSTDIKEIAKYSNNGVIGPGYQSWKTDSKLTCNNCGVIFMPTDRNKYEKPSYEKHDPYRRMFEDGADA